MPVSKTHFFMLQCLVCLLFSLKANMALAERYSLLVGVGDYQMWGSEVDLPGIDVDLKIMRDVSLQLGIKPENITVLFDEAATRQSVLNALQQTAARLDSNDELLLYFSVHGVRVPDTNHDEKDHADEVLAFHDMQVDYDGESPTLQGVITDDELADLLDAIKAERKVLIVDACHSGTMNKSVDWMAKTETGIRKQGKSLYIDAIWQNPEQSKAFWFEPVAGESVALDLPSDDSLELVMLSASREFEEAAPGQNGSLFTRSLGKAFTTLPVKTPYCWYSHAASFVREASERIQHPVILGNFIRSNTRFGEESAGAVAAADALNECLSKGAFTLIADKQNLQSLDRLKLTADSVQNGTLYLLAVQESSMQTLSWGSSQISMHGFYQLSRGKQHLPGKSNYWTVEFEPGEARVLGMWVTEEISHGLSIQSESFNWQQWSMLEVEHMDSTSVKLNIN